MRYLDVYTVSFFGHRCVDNFPLAESGAMELIKNLIYSKEYVEFLVGRDGDFDQIISSAVRYAKREYFSANSSLVWVMPYSKLDYCLNQKEYGEYYDEIEVCERSASAYYKAAYQIRNREMVDRSHLCVFYVNKESGGAYQTMKYAEKKSKPIINLAAIRP